MGSKSENTFQTRGSWVKEERSIDTLSPHHKLLVISVTTAAYKELQVSLHRPNLITHIHVKWLSCFTFNSLWQHFHGNILIRILLSFRVDIRTFMSRVSPWGERALAFLEHKRNVRKQTQSNLLLICAKMRPVCTNIPGLALVRSDIQARVYKRYMKKTSPCNIVAPVVCVTFSREDKCTFVVVVFCRFRKVKLFLTNTVIETVDIAKHCFVQVMNWIHLRLKFDESYIGQVVQFPFCFTFRSMSLNRTDVQKDFLYIIMSQLLHFT